MTTIYDMKNLIILNNSDVKRVSLSGNPYLQNQKPVIAKMSLANHLIEKPHKKQSIYYVKIQPLFLGIVF